MGFSDELTNTKTSNTFGDNAPALPAGNPGASTEATASAKAADAKVAELASDPNAMFSIPKDGDPPPGAEAKPAASESTVVVATIGDKQFTDMNKAMAYANELHVARGNDESYIEGLKAGQKQQGLETNVTQEKAEELITPAESKELEDLMYTDPTKYVTRTAEINKRIAQKVSDQAEESRKQVAAQEQAKTNWWAEVYKKFPDLAKDQNYTQGLMQTHLTQFAAMDSTKAVEAFGNFAIGKVKEFTDKFAPTQVLQDKPANVAAVSTNPGSGKPAEEKPPMVDFVSQLRKNSNVSGIRGS